MPKRKVINASSSSSSTNSTSTYASCQPTLTPSTSMGAYVGGDLFTPLMHYINHADIVFGCVAWCTSPQIIKALKQKQVIGLVVHQDHKIRGKQLLLQLPHWSPNQYEETKDIKERNTTAAVRCWKPPGAQKSRYVKPRLHHKFLVFCRKTSDNHFVPYGVWTGSANLTESSSLSRENAVYINNEELAQFYFNEWKQIWTKAKPICKGK